MTSLPSAPEGSKFWLLHLGDLIADEGFVLRGGGTSTASNPNPKTIRRSLVVYAVLFEIKGEDGLILYETGCGDDFEEKWGDVALDVFAPEPRPFPQELSLRSQVEKTGHTLEDIKHVILGHLHLWELDQIFPTFLPTLRLALIQPGELLSTHSGTNRDHAGGINLFKDRKDVTFYCHETELKHAFFAAATKMDSGVYLPHYLRPELTWETFHEKEWEIFPGMKLIHAPGHSPGLILCVITLKESGTFIFTSDMYHIAENYTLGITQGWLARDHNSWYSSHMMIKRLAKQQRAKVVPGHDSPTFYSLRQNPEHYA